jgi:NADPH:quinone reductase-like Zn-dependent oxidoreductase
MKAAVHTKYGPPDVVKFNEVALPVPKDKEVLIKVHASTVNRTDCGFRSAEYFISRFFSGLLRPKQQTLGNEFAGEIAGIGAEVRSFAIGDKVFGYSDLRFGSHAEYMLMGENEAIAFMPENLSFEEAAPVCEGGHYALCDVRATKISNGQKVLINGASGAIGSAGVQLAKYFGAHVTAVCGTKNTELLKSLGADVVIDYTREDFTQLRETFDVIYDAVGKSSFGKCKHLLKKKGIYKSTELGKNSENIFLALITPFTGGKKVLFPIPTIDKADVIFLKELVETGRFKPVIDRIYPFDDIVEAYRYVETGQKTGNVVIRIC